MYHVQLQNASSGSPVVLTRVNIDDVILTNDSITRQLTITGLLGLFSDLVTLEVCNENGCSGQAAMTQCVRSSGTYPEIKDRVSIRAAIGLRYGFDAILCPYSDVPCQDQGK